MIWEIISKWKEIALVFSCALVVIFYVGLSVARDAATKNKMIAEELTDKISLQNASIKSWQQAAAFQEQLAKQHQAKAEKIKRDYAKIEKRLAAKKFKSCEEAAEYAKKKAPLFANQWHS
ncbi:MAG TPA: hypothetical protein PKO16_07805 [Bacteroidia bacterium]|nr:hypothetical protein [Bacteroidia bacterium]